ncbi:MAG: histidine--tRNA ligase [Saprospiraceae bacterium]|nr:histidine--tRNA ligase [Saprospiraceae bacterium]
MKPSIPKGTRDFTPIEVARRQYIFSTIKDIFERFGFQPIETPVMENLSTLTGKYGEEGDKLLFKVLNNGDFLAKADPAALAAKDSNGLVRSIARRGLRYDLTVPFARFVVMHRNELNFPFKRYQIQPVWRADRPQKGRYQEFYQCDVDAIGSRSLIYEAEYVQIIDQVFTKLDLSVKILINNRKILTGIAEKAAVLEKMTDMTVAIDKLQKIGWDEVNAILERQGFSPESIDAINALFQVTSLDELENALAGSEVGEQGIQEVRQVFSYLDGYHLKQELKFDTTLARGLDYYTGCIFEVQSLETKMGSILGGGRYDDLTGVFGMPDTSGVGISFGVERIYDILMELDRFPDSNVANVDVLLIAFDASSHLAAFKMLSALRSQHIKADLYPEPTKMKKQMRYADNISVPFVILIGSEELESEAYTLKDMRSGQQWSLSLTSIIDKLQSAGEQ